MYRGLFEPMHLLLLLVIVLLVFGPKKLPELGKGIGDAINGFKASMKDGNQTASNITGDQGESPGVVAESSTAKPVLTNLDSPPN